MTTCIYCLSADPVCGFNDEHVMPEAFGTFELLPHLHCVCSDCNQSLGNTIETRFARGSFEGLLRYANGITDPTKLKQRLHGRLNISMLDQDGSYVLAEIGPSPTDSTHTIALRSSQVGLRKRGELEFAYSPLRGFAPSTYDTEEHEPQLSYICDKPEDYEQLVALVRDLGGDLTIEQLQNREMPSVTWGTCSLRFEAVVGDDEKRVIAKIAFNYAAWQLGASFVLNNGFDPMRRFIRYGEQTGYADFTADEKEIHKEHIEREADTRHHVGVAWYMYHASKKLGVAAGVRICNTTTYRIFLTENYTGLVLPEIRRGHRFNWKARTVESAEYPERNGKPLAWERQ